MSGIFFTDVDKSKDAVVAANETVDPNDRSSIIADQYQRRYQFGDWLLRVHDTIHTYYIIRRGLKTDYSVHGAGPADVYGVGSFLPVIDGAHLTYNTLVYPSYQVPLQYSTNYGPGSLQVVENASLIDSPRIPRVRSCAFLIDNEVIRSRDVDRLGRGCVRFLSDISKQIDHKPVAGLSISMGHNIYDTDTHALLDWTLFIFSYFRAIYKDEQEGQFDNSCTSNVMLMPRGAKKEYNWSQIKWTCTW